MEVVNVLPCKGYPVQELLGRLNEVEEKYAPVELFASGDVAILHQGPRVAIVGSRIPSPQGAACAKSLARTVAAAGGVVVSGLALGIDTIAHSTAMEAGGKTIAVLGTPLDQAYPRENASLQERIAREHLVLTQFATGTRTGRHSFPKRNRTMALIADATVIVEASEKSGTMHQGWEALRLGRPLFFAAWLLKDRPLSWASEMQGYGAQILPEDGYEYLAEFLPERGHDTQSVASF